jgi:hypothetical protein
VDEVINDDCPGRHSWQPQSSPTTLGCRSASMCRSAAATGSSLGCCWMFSAPRPGRRRARLARDQHQRSAIGQGRRPSPLRLRSATLRKPSRKSKRSVGRKILLSRRASRRYWPGSRFTDQRTQPGPTCQSRESVEGKFPSLMLAHSLFI